MVPSVASRAMVRLRDWAAAVFTGGTTPTMGTGTAGRRASRAMVVAVLQAITTASSRQWASASATRVPTRAVSCCGDSRP
ncbi:hypothetical protein GCM10009099_00190 [Caenispirillum bisanense]